jgi:hypothetical protein
MFLTLRWSSFIPGCSALSHLRFDADAIMSDIAELMK